MSTQQKLVERMRLFDSLERRRAAQANASYEAATSPNDQPPVEPSSDSSQPASGEVDPSTPEENDSSDRGLWSPARPRRP